MSQRDEILKALQAGDRLTPLTALERFNSLTLSQRVTELRASGYDIRSRLVPVGTNKHVAEYWIPREEPLCPHP